MKFPFKCCPFKCFFGHKWEYYNHITDDYSFGAVSYEYRYRYCKCCGKVQVAFGNYIGMPTFNPTLYRDVKGVPVFGIRRGEVVIKAVKRG